MARINISIDSDDLAMLDKNANHLGMSRSEFIRHMSDWYVMSGAKTAFEQQYCRGFSVKTIHWAHIYPLLREANHEMIEEAYK